MTPGAEQPGLPGFDPARPASARVSDYMAGGKDNFAADRDQALRLLQVIPAARDLTARSRLYAARAVRALTAGGIGQVLDLGCGLSPGWAAPGARAVLVDWDPMVICHLTALNCGPGMTAVRADLAGPALVLKEAAGCLDLAEPVIVVATAIASHWDAAAFAQVTAGYMAGVAAGSALVVTVPWFADGGMWERIREACDAPIWNHSPAAVESFLDGLDVPAGVEVARGYRPEALEPDGSSGVVLAATGLKG